MFSLSANHSAAVEFNRGDVPDRLVLNRPEEGAGDFYAAFYRDGGAQALSDLRRHQMPQLASLARLGAAAPHTTHLDVGCGTGAAVRFINEHFAHIHSYGIEPGLDRDEPPLFRATLAGLESVAGLPPAFDLMSFLDVLEHFQDPREVLDQARARLAPDGRLIVKVPTRSALIYRAAKYLRHLAPGLSRIVLRRLYQVDYTPPHYVYFDLRSLTSLLEEAGFAVERHAYVTEVPLAYLWRRLWGMTFPVRVAAFVCLLPIKALATQSRKECLAVIARRVD